MVTVPMLPGFTDPVHQSQQTFRSLLEAIAHPGSIQPLSTQPLSIQTLSTQPLSTQILALGKDSSQGLSGLSAPYPLKPACAAACLSLFDADTRIWIQDLAPNVESLEVESLEVKPLEAKPLEVKPSEIQTWLQFHTGCRWASSKADADFAIILAPQRLLSLDGFNLGDPEIPEQSTTLLIQVDGFQSTSQPESQTKFQAEFQSESSNQNAANPMLLSGPGIATTQPLSVQGLSPSFWQQLAHNHSHYPMGLDVFLFSETEVVGLPRTTMWPSDSHPAIPTQQCSK